MEFRNIPKGSFRKGSRGNDSNEEPIHRVVIPQDFYLGTFPVTQAQYRAMAEECREELSRIEDNKGSDPSYFKGDMRRVESVSWDEAMLIGRWLSRSGLLVAGWQAGLPKKECHSPDRDWKSPELPVNHKFTGEPDVIRCKQAPIQNLCALAPS